MYYFDANSKRFRLNIRVVHMRDLNFVLQFEIFVNFDEQLWVSHLILGYTLVYTTWWSALLVDNPLLSYIDVRHASFLPLQLTVGEARDLGPRYTTADSIDRQRTLRQILYLKAIESTYSSKSKEHQPEQPS